jgi:hypothetical protein
MWWSFAHYLARNLKMRSMNKLLPWARKTGKRKMVRKGNGQRKTCSYQVGNRDYYLDIFPPKTANIPTVSNQNPGQET